MTNIGPATTLLDDDGWEVVSISNFSVQADVPFPSCMFNAPIAFCTDEPRSPTYFRVIDHGKTYRIVATTYRIANGVGIVRGTVVP